jgi:hypothetical protein
MENETIKKNRGVPTSLFLTPENAEYVKKNMHWKFAKTINKWIEEEREQKRLM